MRLLPDLREPPHLGWLLVLSGLFVVLALASALALRLSARWERAAYIEYGATLTMLGDASAEADSLRRLVGERLCIAWWPPEAVRRRARP